MSWLLKIPPVGRAHRALRTAAEAVWSRDRAPLRGLAALRNRSFRIAIRTVRGIIVHRIGLQSAALTYYTVFATVPMLVVVLWGLRSLDKLPTISSAIPTNVPVPTGNQMLLTALGTILDAVARTSEVTTGLVGLGALLFAVSKMFLFTERALHIISGAGQRNPNFSRALAYVALLLIPPVALGMSGLLLAVIRAWPSTWLARILRSVPGLELGVVVAMGFGALWLAVTLLYSAAVRARIPLSSAAVGGALAALALPVIFWAFASFQIGVSQTSAVSSGFLALPVFLLWVFSSWYAVLIGAEIAVAHRLDRVLVHGASAFRLDCAGQRRAGVAIMVQMARTTEAAGTRVLLTEDQLGRDLRLPPNLVRELCLRLVRHGLLIDDAQGFYLRGIPDEAAMEIAADAVDRDLTLDRGSPTDAPL